MAYNPIYTRVAVWAIWAHCSAWRGLVKDGFKEGLKGVIMGVCSGWPISRIPKIPDPRGLQIPGSQDPRSLRGLKWDILYIP